jgi:predicted nuclease of predicted toxin-antitoxin system
MRFLLDENIEYRLAAHLTQFGHDITAIAQDYPPSLPDQEVLAIATREERILITDNRDFGELAFRHRHPHAGVIYFRLANPTTIERIEHLDQVLVTHAQHLDQFLIVTLRSVRVRRR